MTSFVKFVRNLFGRVPRVPPVPRPSANSRSRMDPEEQLVMLDQLSVNCTRLRQDLLALNGDKEQQVILEYLKEVTCAHDPIEDFPSGLDWCNVTEPLSLDGNLRGKIVVLDFFTYCCINCMHILPDLAKLEEEFPIEKGLVVVGVHSAKFANEKDSGNILAAAQRYNIAHPIVNDSQFRMWKGLNVHCWPTLLVLGPNKNPLFVLTGEGHGALLMKYIAASLKFYGERKEIKMHSLPVRPSLEMLKGQTLLFPAKISCNSKGQIAVSDSGNHRILIVSQASGGIVVEIGGREAGFKDGSFTDCRFNSPQGICFYGEEDEFLFVADTENHAIRRINLKEKIVETVVGTGKQGNDYQGGRTGGDQSISSPWDVAFYKTEDGKEMILIAIAGTHQIWSLFLKDCSWWRGKNFQAGQCAAVAGNGHEENRNNSYPNNAAFAQPSGLAMDTIRKELFIADSESSTVRKIVMVDGKVQAVVGGDRNPKNLFAFGDLDGKQVNAKLQHPLGVCYNPRDKMIYVADTYNHKIKRIDPESSTIETLEIKEKKNSGEKFNFKEPGGLCVDSTGEKLLVADTNNHSIVLVDLKDLTGDLLEIESNDEMDVGRSDLVCPLLTGRSNGMLAISFEIKLKDGIHFTEGAPQKCVANFEGSAEKQEKAIQDNGKVAFEMKTPDSEGLQKIIFRIRLSLCENDLCFPKSFSIECPVQLNSNVTDNANQNVIVHVDKANVRL